MDNKKLIEVAKAIISESCLRFDFLDDDMEIEPDLYNYLDYIFIDVVNYKPINNYSDKVLCRDKETLSKIIDIRDAIGIRDILLNLMRKNKVLTEELENLYNDNEPR